MDEEFRRWLVVHQVCVAVECRLEEVGGFALAQVEDAWSVGRVPGTECSSEDEAVAAIQEELRGAARGAGIFAPVVFLEDEPEVAHATSDVHDLPWSACALVERAAADVPRDIARDARQVTNRFSGGFEEVVGRNRALADDLRWRVCREETRFELVMEVRVALVRLGVRVDLRKQAWCVAQAAGLRA